MSSGRVKVRAQSAAVHLLFCSSDWVEIVKRGIEVNLARPSKYSERLAVQEGQVRLWGDIEATLNLRTEFFNHEILRKS